MNELITRTAKLLPRTKRIKPVPGFATSYHYEVDSPESAELGNLYVVIEVLTSNKVAEAVADLVIETMGNQYYNVEPGDKPALLTRFENAVKATNQALADYTNKGNASWVGRMSSVIAIIAGDALHITQTGSAEAFLYRGNVTSQVTANLQDGGPHRPLNTFANIASGELQLHDRLLIATPALFHQIQRPQLKNLLNDNTAGGTVQKISELINQQNDADRVAAIVVEITSPDLLALQVRSDDPESVEIGQADKPLEVAKAMAAPAARSLMSTSRAVGAKAAEQTRDRVIPKAKSMGWSIAETIRKRLRGRGGRQLAAGLALGLVILLVGIGYLRNADSASTKNLKRYDSIYQEYAAGAAKLAQNDKIGARTTLAAASSDLDSFSKLINVTAFETQLAHHPHPEKDPASIPKLHADITSLLDQIDGLVTLDATLVTDFSAIKNAHPNHVEQIGNKLIMVDGQNSSAIYVYDMVAKTLTTAASTPAGLGHVVATTPSSNGDGVYLLTDEPGVWFFKAFDSSLVKQNVSFGDWPKGRAIAHYAGNLYILASDSSQVYKHVPTAGGFSAKSAYFKDGSVVNGSTALAVDGSIYLDGGTSGLRRLISGKLDQSLTVIPQSLENPSELRSILSGDKLLTLDLTSHRLGLFTNNESAISFDKQIVLKGVSNIYAITTDAKSTTIYAVLDGKLVSAPLPK